MNIKKLKKYFVNLLHTVKEFHNEYTNPKSHKPLVSQHIKIRMNEDKILISRSGHWHAVKHDIEFTRLCVEKFKELNIELDNRGFRT